jgi:hypothetical protein
MLGKKARSAEDKGFWEEREKPFCSQKGFSHLFNQ